MEKTKSGWDKTVYLKEQELDDYAWHKRFFMLDWTNNNV
jgi:hypothetical protein